MRLAALATVSALLLASDPSAAAKRTITWKDVMECRNTVEFDDTKHDKAALRNTIEVIFEGTPFMPLVHVSKPEDIATLDLDRFKAECANTISRAEGLSLILLPGLKDYWTAKVEQIRDGCAYGVIEIRGFKDPAALREYQPAAAACSRYVDALEGKTDIVQLWRDTIAESCRNNLDPANCVGNFLARGNRSNATELIRLDIYRFGWGNCANKFTKRSVSRDEPVRSELEQRFKRLFKTRRDETCH